ncbi:hypothetical protein D0544_15870 [Aestuariirhabdus litorea]|uniref:EF-hand domain-containing protein n=2 Tax=Aestuariirhabdus litorea TaxID=2528527 RepID=A0A3P3VNL6_9GAMM|nr:hypothetical protein D0544_15870 [Aestuariirhabdus litorea]
MRCLAAVAISVSSTVIAAEVATIDHEFLAKMKAQFEALDSQNLGYLDYQQTAELMPSIADQVTKIDINGDQKVTWHELEFTIRSFNNVLDSRAAQEIRSLDPVQQ